MKHTIIDCEVNTLENLCKGEPMVFGFDYYCKDEDTNETVEFVKDQLNNNNIPLLILDIKSVMNSDIYPILSLPEIAKDISNGYRL